VTATPRIRRDGSDVLLTLRVQPRASRNQLIVQPPDRILLRLTAPPVEGAANAAGCAVLAELFGVAKSRVVIERGETGRDKLIRIRDVDAAEILARLQSCQHTSFPR
jgi:uncharacterized protein